MKNLRKNVFPLTVLEMVPKPVEITCYPSLLLLLKNCNAKEEKRKSGSHSLFIRKKPFKGFLCSFFSFI